MSSSRLWILTALLLPQSQRHRGERAAGLVVRSPDLKFVVSGLSFATVRSVADGLSLHSDCHTTDITSHSCVPSQRLLSYSVLSVVGSCRCLQVCPSLFSRSFSLSFSFCVGCLVRVTSSLCIYISVASSLSLSLYFLSLTVPRQLFLFFYFLSRFPMSHLPAVRCTSLSIAKELQEGSASVEVSCTFPFACRLPLLRGTALCASIPSTRM